MIRAKKKNRRKGTFNLHSVLLEEVLELSLSSSIGQVPDIQAAALLSALGDGSSSSGLASSSLGESGSSRLSRLEDIVSSSGSGGSSGGNSSSGSGSLRSSSGGSSVGRHLDNGEGI